MPVDPVVLATLVLYLLLMLGVGAWAARRNRDGGDYYLGGRGLGPWVGALSSASSSSSAWTLLGVSGAAYTYGLGAVWILPACLGGFVLNWFVVAGPLREATVRSGAVTVTEWLAEGSPPRAARRLVRMASVIVLVSLATYVASQFQAAGKTFAETFGLNAVPAVLVGAVVVLAYTVFGGFWAVSVTDTIQGLVMAAAAVIVPLAALLAAGGPAGMFAGLRAADPLLTDPFRGLAAPAALGMVIGTFGIGLGYPGQPHVINRFMAMRDAGALRRGRTIAVVWALLIYSGMLVAGWCAHAVLVSGPADPEAALIGLTRDLLPPAVAGAVIAAILSAVMSTADSQLLVCASTLAYDLGGGRSGAAALRRGRVTVLVVGVIAAGAAVLVDETIFNMVLFAWSSLGAAFGPLVLVRLKRGPVAPGHAQAAMAAGFVVSVAWFALKKAGVRPFADLYELVPAFAIALAIAWRGSGKRAVSPPA
ncbi:MAG TPA: sodium/proline symporter [Planctomycetota bacterium]